MEYNQKFIVLGILSVMATGGILYTIKSNNNINPTTTQGYNYGRQNVPNRGEDIDSSIETVLRQAAIDGADLADETDLDTLPDSELNAIYGEGAGQ